MWASEKKNSKKKTEKEREILTYSDEIAEENGSSAQKRNVKMEMKNWMHETLGGVSFNKRFWELSYVTVLYGVQRGCVFSACAMIR